MLPLPIITGSAAIVLLRNGLAVHARCIEGSLEPAIGETWDAEIWLDGCVVERFDGSVTQFTQPVKFTDCHFKDCAFVFAYFLQGLVIENCTFATYLDFQAGGHNGPGYPISITKSRFAGFVNFFDCWYKGEVFIADNSFSQGTNISSKQQLITFEVAPIISGNQGLTDIEAEHETG